MIAITRAMSAALLHFVWQGLAVTILIWLALFLLRKRSASLRYWVSCGALALLAVLPAITTWALYERPGVATQGASVLVSMVAAVTPVPDGARFDWLARAQAWAVPIWSFGVLLFSLRMAWGCTQIAALRRAGEAADEQLRAAFANLAGRMGVTRPVLLMLSKVTDSPSVTGWLRPIVLLPLSAVAGLTPDQLEAVLAHELAHIRRHDYLVNLLQMAAETLLFYHPAVWWISGRIRHERELCCDDLAVRTCGGALSYARALTALEKMRAARPALALGSTDGPLFYRIRRLVMGGGEYGPSKLSGAIALTLALACVALSVNWARAQEPARVFVFRANPSQDSDGIKVDTAGAVLLHRPHLEYPEELLEKRVQGTLSVEATLDNGGQVIDARVLSGPNELRKAALTSVLNWHFAPGSGTTRIVQITFQPPSGTSKPEGERGFAVLMSEASGDALTQETLLAAEEDIAMARRQTSLTSAFLNDEIAALGARLTALQNDPSAEADQMNKLRAQLAEMEAKVAKAHHAVLETQDRYSQIEALRMQLMAEEKAGNARDRSQDRLRYLRAQMHELTGVPDNRLAAIEIRGLSEQAGKDLLSRLPVHEGDTLTADSIDAARQIVRRFDEHLEFNFGRANNGVTLRIHPAGAADAPVLRK